MFWLSARLRLLFFSLLFLSHHALLSQNVIYEVRGRVINIDQDAISEVSVFLNESKRGTITNDEGYFSINIEQNESRQKLIFKHIKYVEKEVLITLFLESSLPLTITLEDSVRILRQVDVIDENVDLPDNVSTFELDPLAAQFNPAPFQDISTILVTLPGVSSRNEFSTAYSVRGGNYDENLVYVNNIPVYRPQIVTSGQQEGLSFVNTDLVRGIAFSSGGWEAKYGDGLASTLNIDYKRPAEFGGSLNVGLLGGSVHLQGATEDQRFTYLLGARHKRAQYLLQTLETDGEYQPRFSDIQTYLNYDISKGDERGNTELGLLFSYARNRYQVIPTSRETTFGTFNEQKRLFVAFDGQDRLTYDTWQAGIHFSHRLSEGWKTHLIISGIYSREREYYDIESGYRLCNVDNNPSSPGFNECLTNIGIGTNYYSGRNLLDVQLANVESRNEIIINNKNMLEWGVGYAEHAFDDRLSEYEFIDSADYVTITDAVDTEAKISYRRLHGYVQNTSEINWRHTITFGVRVLYQDFGGDLLLSPRVQYSWKPSFLKDGYLRASAGLYHQAPFYREFRDPEGNINEKLRAQSSFQGIIGMDLNFTKWGRPFKFITEVYYKNLWNVNPYDIENVRIRYYANNDAVAYAAGVDFRLSGEFIPGDESWFSLGFLKTQEDLLGDERGYIPRPTDQRVNVAIFFQDHIPKIPSFKVHLRLLYSSGLPFSPPVNPRFRNGFRGGEYQRVDIGFSKLIKLGANQENPFLKSLWLSAEVLNLTGHQNIISYYWVKDVNNIYYAVPNSLSQRFFNVRANLKF